MFSADQIAVYLKYRGDIDGFARAGSQEEKALLSDSDWFHLSSLIDNFSMAGAGLASSEFAAKAELVLAEAVPDAGLRAELEKIACRS